MNIRNYIRLKNGGYLSLVKVGRVVYAREKHFDPDTGLEGEPTDTALSLPELNVQSAELQALLNNVTTLISDIEAL